MNPQSTCRKCITSQSVRRLTCAAPKQPQTWSPELLRCEVSLSIRAYSEAANENGDGGGPKSQN
eukprot:1694071-Alexandrium_andersonii.AAC.1